MSLSDLPPSLNMPDYAVPTTDNYYLYLHPALHQTRLIQNIIKTVLIVLALRAYDS